MKTIFVFFLSLISLPAMVKERNTLVFSEEKTIYEINKDYDLKGKTISIPAGCTLKYKGGVIKNGTLKGNGTSIDADYQQLFGTNLRLLGDWKVEAWIPEWFGAKGEKGIKDTQALQCSLDAAKETKTKVVKLLGKTYYIDAPLKVYPYTSLIGSEQTASWLYATQIMPIEGVDAIRLIPSEKEGRSTSVTLKNLIIRNGTDTYYSNSGIFIGDNTKQYGVSKLRLDNVQILYFDYGVKADLYGNSPFSDCYFFNVECAHNNIGFCVDGHFEGGNNGHKVWMNVNRFEFCRFSENRTGGIFVHNVWMFLNNVFDQCTIEGNGKDYNLSLYNKYGVFGAKFANKYTPVTGGNAFQNCYFEINLPKRKGDAVEKSEYKYGDYIYPEGFTESKMVGNIFLQQHDFNFSNCISSRNKCFVLLNDNSHVSITGTIIYDLEKVTKTDSKRYFIEFNDAYVPSSVNTERNHFNISKGNTLHYFHFIATPKGGESRYTIRKDDLDDGGKVQLDNMPVRQLLKQ